MDAVLSGTATISAASASSASASTSANVGAIAKVANGGAILWVATVWAFF